MNRSLSLTVNVVLEISILIKGRHRRLHSCFFEVTTTASPKPFNKGCDMVAVNFSVFIGIGVKDANVGGDSPKVGLVNFGLV